MLGFQFLCTSAYVYRAFYVWEQQTTSKSGYTVSSAQVKVEEEKEENESTLSTYPDKDEDLFLQI